MQNSPAAQIQQAQSLHHQGHLTQAIEVYCQLLPRFPNDPQLLFLLGTATLQVGRTEEGLNLLGRSLQLFPDQASAWASFGLGLKTLDRLEEALASFDRALALKPDFAEAHYNRGNVLHRLGRASEALASYTRAIAVNARFPAALNGRANALKDLKRAESALADYQRAIAIKPDYADAYYNLGVALQDLERPAQAVASYDRALAIDPDMAEAYNNRGRALRYLGRVDAALNDYARAMVLKPDFVEAYINRGVALYELRRLDEAISDYDRALALRPDEPDARWNKALAKLLAGDLEQGWRLYESRLRRDTVMAPLQPQWRGEWPIAGKALRIYAEQGSGDVIQFCRYAVLLSKLDVNVIIEVPAALVALLATLKGHVEVFEQGSQLPHIDAHCPILSLPFALKTTLGSIPSQTPYLWPNVDKVAAVERRLGPKTRPRVGLVWSGSPAHQNDHNRSLALQLLAPLLGVDVDFHALQKDCRPRDQAALRHLPQITTHQDELNDFSDTAALVAAMDLVVSVDTSVAHLAGALGRPVWILLPFAPDFRWLLDRSDSPWYPSATLFRQPAFGDWTSVVKIVVERLQQWLK